MGNSSTKQQVDLEELAKLRQENDLLKYKLSCYQTGGEISSDSAESDSEVVYDSLVISGGGVKGVCAIGALEELDRRGLYAGITNFAGTSAGSIIASLLAVGYTIKELKKIMLAMDMNVMVDDKFGVVRDVYNLITDLGWAPGNVMVKMFGDLIEKKTGNRDFTFDDLYKKKQIKLIVVGSDMTNSKPIYFYPGHKDKALRNTPIVTAVRISVSVPYLFEPIYYKDRCCVDGGVFANYPIYVFDGEHPDDNAQEQMKPNRRVLGLRLMMDSDIIDTPNSTSNLMNYTSSFLDAYFALCDRQVMVPKNMRRSIIIITRNRKLTDFSVSQKEKLAMIEDGRRATVAFLR